MTNKYFGSGRRVEFLINTISSAVNEKYKSLLINYLDQQKKVHDNDYSIFFIFLNEK